MKSINAWDSGISNFFYYINTIEEFEDYALNNECYFDVKDKFEIGDISTTKLEDKAVQNNSSINYTDENHNVAICNSYTISKNFISTEFYNKYKDRINNVLIQKLLGPTEKYVTVPGFLFSDELLDKLLDKCESIYLENLELTDEQREKIKDKFINCILINNGIREKISSNELVGHYTKKDLDANNDIFHFDKFLDDREIENFKYFKDDAYIEFNYFGYSNQFTSKDKSRIQIMKVLNRLDNLNINANIKIYIDSRMDIYDILSEFENLKNIKPIIRIGVNDYSFDEYMKENNKLNSLVDNIKNSTMSPFEKYMAIYNIVKLYKPYKENPDDKEQSRDVRYLLDNEYMVCAGYANLLKVLLERVGIDSYYYSTSVYKPAVKEDGSNETIDLKGGHARNLVNIVDPKYGIDGIFMADATWDNHKNKGDTYDYALLPIDNMDHNRTMFSLESVDYFLDVHNFNEYNTKVNQYLNLRMRKDKYNKDNHKKLMDAYYKIYMDIMLVLEDLDHDKFMSYENLNKISIFDRDENFYIDFLTDFGNYIVSKSNKRIPSEVIAEAASVAKQYGRDEPDAFRMAYADKVKKVIDSHKMRDYPFEIDENGEAKIR